MLWLFGVAELCLAITLNIKVSGILFACSFAFYFLVVMLRVALASDTSAEAERLIPFVAAYVDDVSLEQRRITVDWGLDF